MVGHGVFIDVVEIARVEMVVGKRSAGVVTLDLLITVRVWVIVALRLSRAMKPVPINRESTRRCTLFIEIEEINRFDQRGVEVDVLVGVLVAVLMPQIWV